MNNKRGSGLPKGVARCLSACPEPHLTLKGILNDGNDWNTTRKMSEYDNKDWHSSLCKWVISCDNCGLFARKSVKIGNKIVLARKIKEEYVEPLQDYLEGVA